MRHHALPTRRLRLARQLRYVALAALTVAAVPIVGSAIAGAAGPALGTVAFTPTSGDSDTPMTVTTPAACPDSATHLIVLVSGGDSGSQVVSSNSSDVIVGLTALSAFPKGSGGGLVVSLTQSMRDFAQASGFTPISGSYTYTVVCRTSSSPTSLGDFTGTAKWTRGAGAFDATYTATGGSPSPSPSKTPTASPTSRPRPTASPSDTPTATISASPPPQAVILTLGVSPAGVQTAGSPVTLRASVTPPVAGSVQFLDGNRTLGTPVAVTGATAGLVRAAAVTSASASGVATLRLGSVAAGRHSFSARFQALSGAVAAVASPVAYVVRAASAPGSSGSTAGSATSSAATQSGTPTGSAAGLPRTGLPLVSWLLVALAALCGGGAILLGDRILYPPGRHCA